MFCSRRRPEDGAYSQPTLWILGAENRVSGKWDPFAVRLEEPKRSVN